MQIDVATRRLINVIRYENPNTVALTGFSDLASSVPAYRRYVLESILIISTLQLQSSFPLTLDKMAAAKGSAVRHLIRSLEVQSPKDSTYAITQWVNSDLIPMDRTRRIWGGWKYVVYWATGGKPSGISHDIGAFPVDHGLTMIVRVCHL